MSKKLKLSSFILKIIALVTMTFQHFVLIFCRNSFYLGSIAGTLLEIGLYVGTLSFILFAFMISEGMRYTHNRLFYLLRLAIPAVVLSILGIVFENAYNLTTLNNIFVDLSLGAAIIYCLDLPRYKKFFVLIPLTLLGVLLVNNYTLYLYYFTLRVSYGIYGILLIVGFYYVRLIQDKYLKYQCAKMDVDFDAITVSNEYKFISNVFASLVIVVVNLSCWIVGYLCPAIAVCDWSYQGFSTFAIILILFYSGTRGYNAKWFQYGCYLYYPLHLIIMYVISIII